MSLTGSLEDLPLLDIIQIVSFSKKTGYLAIRVEGQDAAIVFHAGLVLCSYTWDSLPVDARAAALSSAAREGMIRKRIEIALEQLIRLREGEFNFSLTEAMPTQVGTRDIRAETLAEGINPQELLLDLARGMDEDRRDSSAVLEASFASPDDVPDEDLSSVSSFVRGAPAFEAQGDLGAYTMPVPVVSAESVPAKAREGAMRDLLELPAPVSIPEAAVAAAPVPAPKGATTRRVMLVDDEDDVRATLARHLVAGGYEVHEAGSPDEAVRLAGRLVKAGSGDFLLVTDLGMPASGGASFQGGFELVKRLWKMNLKPPVLMMTESLGTTLRARARQMGVTHFVFKPGLSKLDPEQFEADLEAFAARLVHDLLPVMQPPQGRQPAKAAAVPVEGERLAAATDEASRQMRALRQHLDELRQRGDAAQISLLIMKVAREFFERAVLFLVKNDELRGLGGFGPAPREENLNLLVREVVIPLGEPTTFQRVVNGCKPWAGELPDGKGSGQVMVKIGRFKSTRVALLPLLTHRQTTALLFGDNPETGRDLERLDALEVFLDQAGVALENVFLQRKLQSLEA